jgi:hypothetical protein
MAAMVSQSVRLVASIDMQHVTSRFRLQVPVSHAINATGHRRDEIMDRPTFAGVTKSSRGVRPSGRSALGGWLVAIRIVCVGC